MNNRDGGAPWPGGPMSPDPGGGMGNQVPPGAPMPYPAFAPPPPGPPPGSGRRIALISVAVLVAALVIGGAGIAIGLALGGSPAGEQARPSETERPSVADVRAAARQAACDFTATMTTYDYRDLDTYRRAVDAGSTGTFKSDFGSTFPELSDLMVSMQMTSASTGNQCVYQSGNSRRAEVIVHADYTVTKALEPTPQPERQVFTVTMKQVDGRWLCSQMTPTQSK